MVLKIFKGMEILFETCLSAALMILGVMLCKACVEDIIIQEEMKDFMEESVFEKEIGRYKIYAHYTNEVVDETMYYNKYGKPELGNTGDIFIMPQSKMDVVPFSEQFIGYLFGGHAGMLVRNDETTFTGSIEAMGGTLEEAYVLDYDIADICGSEDRTVIGLRVKTTKEKRQQAYNYAKTRIGMDYSYNYVAHKKDAYYCTDFCSRVYGEEAGLDLNLDENGFYTTTQDLFFSNDTEISFIKIQDDVNIYIYYLKGRK